MKFHPGDRVGISDSCHWAQGATGTIGWPPETAQRLVEEYTPWDGCRHFVQGVNRLMEFYWVDFDEPQNDVDGDGPYTGGEIEVEMLRHLVDDSEQIAECTNR